MSPETPQPVVALLLARGAADALSIPDIKYKALIPIDGRPMADYVLRALQSAEIERIFIVQAEDEALEQALTASPKNTFVTCSSESPNITDSILCGAEAILEHYGKTELGHRIIMSVPCDIPLVQAGDFNHLIRQSHRQEADVFFTAIRLERLKHAYPGHRFHSVYLKNMAGTYSPQNIGFCSGRLLGFGFSKTGERRFEILSRSGREMAGIVDLIEDLRKRRSGLFMWYHSVYQILLRRLFARGSFLIVLRLVIDLLSNHLTTHNIQLVMLAALDLKFGILESDTETFSGDIDSSADLAEILSSESALLTDTGELGMVGSS